MKRRDFLIASLAGGSGVFSAQWSKSIAFELPSASICKVAVTGDVLLTSKRAPNELAYQGTHILTYGALQLMAAAFNATGKGWMHVAGGGCDDGIGAVKLNTADLGGLCCPVAGTKAEGLPWLQVAWDIKTVVTHPSNPVVDLSLEALRAIANGRIRHWSELQGEARPLALVVRRHCPDKLEPVRHLLLDGKPNWSKHSLWVDTDQQLTDTVARFPGAIGVVSNVFAQPLIFKGQLKPLRIDGIAPQREAVAQGSYPLKGPLNLVFKHERTDAILPFLDFLYSSTGQDILARQLVPINREESGYQKKLVTWQSKLALVGIDQ